MSQPEQPDERTVRAVHIDTCLSRALSTDGKSSMVVFKIDDGTDFAFTCPVDKLPQVRTMINDLICEAVQRNIGPTNIHFRRAMPNKPLNFSVGHSDELRGAVALIFEPNTEDQIAYLIADQEALMFAEAIEKDVFTRMSMADRRAMMQKKAPMIIQPGGSRGPLLRP
jgi:hypothetical protein